MPTRPLKRKAMTPNPEVENVNQPPAHRLLTLQERTDRFKEDLKNYDKLRRKYKKIRKNSTPWLPASHSFNLTIDFILEVIENASHIPKGQPLSNDFKHWPYVRDFNFAAFDPRQKLSLPFGYKFHLEEPSSSQESSGSQESSSGQQPGGSREANPASPPKWPERPEVIKTVPSKADLDDFHRALQTFDLPTLQPPPTTTSPFPQDGGYHVDVHNAGQGVPSGYPAQFNPNAQSGTAIYAAQPISPFPQDGGYHVNIHNAIQGVPSGYPVQFDPNAHSGTATYAPQATFIIPHPFDNTQQSPPADFSLQSHPYAQSRVATYPPTYIPGPHLNPAGYNPNTGFAPPNPPTFPQGDPTWPFDPSVLSSLEDPTPHPEVVNLTDSDDDDEEVSEGPTHPIEVVDLTNWDDEVVDLTDSNDDDEAMAPGAETDWPMMDIAGSQGATDVPNVGEYTENNNNKQKEEEESKELEEEEKEETMSDFDIDDLLRTTDVGNLGGEDFSVWPNEETYGAGSRPAGWND